MQLGARACCIRVIYTCAKIPLTNLWIAVMRLYRQVGLYCRQKGLSASRFFAGKMPIHPFSVIDWLFVAITKGDRNAEEWYLKSYNQLRTKRYSSPTVSAAVSGCGAQFTNSLFHIKDISQRLIINKYGTLYFSLIKVNSLTNMVA